MLKSTALKKAFSSLAQISLHSNSGVSVQQGPDDKGGLSMDDVEPIPITSGANLGRTCSNLRPPAVVTEFMSQGSVKSALARKSEVVVGNMHRVVVAMDAAKV